MGSTTQPSRDYRPDIDGLRGIAVLAVVLFHAGLRGVDGGYVGVDVFFVISGFLITRMLLADGSIVRFYLRRARRILPALFVLLALVLPAGALILLPSDYLALAKSALATLGFSSNIWFWLGSGYFMSGDEILPLLHTWSLGVEEQFYLLFPLVVWLARRWPRRKLILLLLGVFALSLALALAGMAGGLTTAVFYHSPPRAWELLAGAILAAALPRPIGNPYLRSALALAGVAAIALPALFYTDATPFPGLTALPVVLGSAALIAAGSGGRHLLSPVLESRPLVFVGLISYSLYLWHWPLLAFARYWLVRPLTLAESAGLVALAFAAAILSWRYVERPFRHGFRDGTIWLLTGGGIAAITTAALAVVALRGIPRRFPPKIVALERQAGMLWHCPFGDRLSFEASRGCALNFASGNAEDAEVVLWGDSHAAMYAPALVAALGRRPALLVNVSGCAPSLSPVRNQHCTRLQRLNYRRILQLPARTVVLAENWPQYRNEAGRSAVPRERYRPGVARLEALVAGLRAAGKQVVVVGPIVRPGYQVASVLSREIAFHGVPAHPVAISRAAFLEEFANVFAGLDRAARDSGVRIIRLDDAICDAERCPYVVDGRSIFADYGHFSTEFARALGPRFAAVLSSP